MGWGWRGQGVGGGGSTVEGGRDGVTYDVSSQSPVA